jgi:hypothetical protein
MQTPFHGVTAYVEVTAQNVAGQDGTLANDYQQDFFELYETDASPDVHRGFPCVAVDRYARYLLLAGAGYRRPKLPV